MQITDMVEKGIMEEVEIKRLEGVIEAVLFTMGESVELEKIAAAIGHPRAARQVGNALHHNPKPGIIPCHRVVGCNGSLTGYAGGIDRKIRLHPTTLWQGIIMLTGLCPTAPPTACDDIAAIPLCRAISRAISL